MICEFYDTEINELAQAVEGLFFDDTVDEKVCDWPERSQEEFAEENVGTEERQEKWNEPYWYDLLMRLGRMGRDTNETEAESENVREEGSDEEE